MNKKGQSRLAGRLLFAAAVGAITMSLAGCSPKDQMGLLTTVHAAPDQSKQERKDWDGWRRVAWGLNAATDPQNPNITCYLTGKPSSSHSQLSCVKTD